MKNGEQQNKTVVERQMTSEAEGEPSRAASKSFGASSTDRVQIVQFRGKSGWPGTLEQWTDSQLPSQEPGVSFPTFTTAGPTALTTVCRLEASGWRTRPTYGSDHGSCGPMEVYKMTVLGPTSASA